MSLTKTAYKQDLAVHGQRIATNHKRMRMIGFKVPSDHVKNVAKQLGAQHNVPFNQVMNDLVMHCKVAYRLVKE